MKYVLVSGGVVSGLGKGISSSSIGVLLQACGLYVTSIKIDPYLNKDAGTMSPFEHGEVYVLDDGGEADLDLGNYERFLNTTLTRDHNITTGKIYSQVIERERAGDYLGKTVQVIPHITDAIQEWIERVAYIPVDHGSKRVPDVCLIELGGTVGDIESMVFLEALRQFQYRVGSDNFCHVSVSFVPVVGGTMEQKSKPTQHCVKELRAAGLPPDILFCRSTETLVRDVIKKISLFCMVPATSVVSVCDVSNIMRVPLLLAEQKVPNLILNKLRINRMPPDDIPEWRKLADTIDAAHDEVKIALVGKYTGLGDAYLSVTKALFHSSIACSLKLKIIWIESENLEERMKLKKNDLFKDAWTKLQGADGILIPGGFGDRGVEGKILACHYARNKKVPFLGVCLGMQVAVIEFARSMCGLEDANSAEFEQHSSHPVIIYMPEIDPRQMGGTMRLGMRPTLVRPGSLAYQLYGKRKSVDERHRHRYEVNPDYVARLEEKGAVFSGRDSKGQRMEIFELPESMHPYFVATQFHPEFLCRPLKPSPPFLGFVQASAGLFVRDTIEEMKGEDAASSSTPERSPVIGSTPSKGAAPPKLFMPESPAKLQGQQGSVDAGIKI